MKSRYIIAITSILISTVWANSFTFADDKSEALKGLKGDVSRGAYLARAAGCIACHTAADEGGKPLAGGVALETPFGTFISPNITTDKAQGIGAWSLEQFEKALRKGISPDGEPYYPAFPYSFYTKMTDQDVVDLWSAFQTVPAIAKSSSRHELNFPYNLRDGLILWRSLFFDEQPPESPQTSDKQYTRGEYLVESITHCAACHTPRNLLGALDRGSDYLGTESMLEGDGQIPEITANQLKKSGWTIKDLSYALKSGLKPDGDVFGGSMGEVVRDSTSYMLKRDLDAIAYYLMNKK
ncbi:MAG: cytochrome c [Oceanospirillaceae bacterium]|nr:cytochrome c [Oceanospirillaceae bacterium]